MKRVTVPALAALLLAVAAPCAQAQLEWNGTLDMATGFGGEYSRFTVNEIPYEYRRPHLWIEQVNLIFFTPVSDDFSVEARLRSSAAGSGTLGPPELALAVINWTPVAQTWSFSLGRFTTPFGLDPARQYPFERTFIAKPLMYGYFVNVSDVRGYWRMAGFRGTYGEDDVGMTPLGYDGYSTGLRYDYINDEETFAVTAAITGATPSSHRRWTNQFTGAFTGRAAWKLAEIWTQGLSAAYGSFMMQDSGIPRFLRNPPQYRQGAFGTDFQVDATPVTLSGEALWTQWFVPVFGDSTYLADPPTSLNVRKVKPTLVSGYLDIRVDIPAWEGFYTALRLETIQFLKMNDPTVNRKRRWDNSPTRWSLAFGHTLHDNIHLKLNYYDQIFRDRDPRKNDWVLRALVSVVF